MLKGHARPRIVILSPFPADFVSFAGGVETATAGLLEGFRDYQNEFDFHVVSTPRGLIDDLTVKRNGFTFHFLGVPDKTWARPRFPWRVSKTYRELRQIRPDLVHCQGNNALTLATVFRKYSLALTLHGILKDEVKKRAGWEFWSAKVDAQIGKFVLGHFDAFICISDYAVGVVGKTRPKFSIPNPVCSLFFHVLKRSTVLSNPYLLFVGVLASLKRPADLLLAHAKLRREFSNLETIFCGEVEDPNYVRAMHRMVVENRVEGVRFLGRVSQESLRDLLAGAVALVLPSAQENAPMVIAEAMAAGTAVVATRVGGIPEMIRDRETGLLYEIGRINELADCLKRLLTDLQLRERLGHAAKQFAEATYTSERVAGATVSVYRQLLDERTGLKK